MTIDALRTKEGMITLLELDRVPAMADGMELQMSQSDHLEILSDITQKMIQVYTPHVSGVVLSPEHSFRHRSEVAATCVPLLSIEKKTAAVDPLAAPSLVENWSVENIANNYAVAKLELYYHPAEAQAALKKQMVAEIYDYCQYEGIEFVLELLVYHQANEKPSPEGMTEAQLFAVQEFRESCDVLALEYLGDSLAAVTITAELDIPWIVTSRSGEYEECKRELRASLESGAQGFLLGDVFWPKVSHAEGSDGSVNVSMLKTEIEHQSRDHLLELVRITKEFALKNQEKTA